MIPPGTRDETHLHRTIDLRFNPYWKVVLHVYRAAGVHSDGGEYYCRVPQAYQTLEPNVWRAETTNIYIPLMDKGGHFCVHLIYMFVVSGHLYRPLPSSQPCGLKVKIKDMFVVSARHT